MKLRFFVLIFSFFLIFSGLIFNLYDIQIKKGKSYAEKALAQFKNSRLIFAKRGEIYFSDKNDNLIPAAINKSYKFVYVVPSEVDDQAGVAENLANILNIDKSAILKKVGKISDSYEEIATKISNEDDSQITSLNLKGVYVDSRDFRYYPYNELASQTLGFVGPSGDDYEIKGRYGIESLFNNDLKGEDGVNAQNILLPAESGKDIVLNIDRNIQAKAEEILKRVIEERKATSGTVIVEDPETGKILTMASYPNFNPNTYSKYPLENLLNPAIQMLYEPGSVFKPITMASGIESGKITPDSIFNDTGSLVLNKKKITNFAQTAYGKVNMTQIIENSINTGSAYVASLLGRDLFKKFVESFGFGEKTGISLPGELRGNIKSIQKDVQDINIATASFGQGIAVTPISLISAISAIANGGNIFRPLIFKNEKPEVLRRVISEESAKDVTDMMVKAVLKGKYAMVHNYNVAGKTGTAQISKLKSAGYEEDAYIHTFVGFAPAYRPKFVALIKIDRPQVGPLAGVTVVPAFRELAEFILDYYNVPPDNLDSVK